MDFCITTSRRKALFDRTLSSFVSCCQDIEVIDRVLLLDDGSVPPEVDSMAAALRAAFNSDVVCSTVPAPLGRLASAQRWFHLVNGDYCFHSEDDWEYVRAFKIADLVHVLERPACACIGQLALSRRGTGAENHDGYWIWNLPGKWPHFTTNPQLQRIAAFKSVGNFEAASTYLDVQPSNEFAYGLRWMDRGWKTAYTWEPVVRHIGQGQSAYVMNGTRR